MNVSGPCIRSIFAEPVQGVTLRCKGPGKILNLHSAPSLSIQEFKWVSKNWKNLINFLR